MLKDSEIRALQSQINPHFLFNVLNAIAWKAEMSDNNEIYDMTIALGELLKATVKSKNDFAIPLSEELKYVKFYSYLQRIRFEASTFILMQVLIHIKFLYFVYRHLLKMLMFMVLNQKKVQVN